VCCLFPVVGLGDISELLLDGISVDIVEAEGLRGGSGKPAPLGGVPAARGRPHRVHARGLDLLDRFLNSIEAVHKSGVGLREGDVQQLSVVVFVLNHFKVGVVRSEEHHFAG